MGMDQAPVSFDFDHLLSITQTRQVLGVGRTTVYVLLKEGRLTALKLGRRTLISARQVQLLIDCLSNQGCGLDDGDGA